MVTMVGMCHVSEVIPVDDHQGSGSNNWCLSISAAEEKSRENILTDALGENSDLGLSIPERLCGKEHETVDDDDYWAQYDNTPARTPGPKQPSPANGTTNVDRRGLATSDVEYFARYGQVQPEMENDDPSEDSRTLGQSSLMR